MLENCYVSLKGSGVEAKLNDQVKSQRALYPQELPNGLRNSVTAVVQCKFRAGKN